MTESRPGLEGPPGLVGAGDPGIDHLVLADTAVGALFERERIDAVLLAGDWIAAERGCRRRRRQRVVAGMAAMAGGGPVPVFVAAPIATFDAATPDGAAIPRGGATGPRPADPCHRHTPRAGARLEPGQ